MAVLGLGGLLLVLQHGKKTHDESVEQLLRAMALSVGTSFSAYDPRLGRHPIADVAAELGASDRVIDLEVKDPSGKILWSNGPVTSVADDRPRAVLPLAKRSSCLPCHAQSPDPIATLHLAADREHLLGGRVAYETLAMVLTGLMVLAMTALILLLMNRMVLIPLGRLVRVMSQVEEGDFFARAEVKTNDEIGLLASTFNKLVSKITDLRVQTIDTERELIDVKDEQQQLSFLFALGRELAGVLDPDPLVARLAEMVHQQLAVPEFTVLLFEPDGTHAVVKAAIGFPADTIATGKPLPLEGSVSAEAARKRQPIYVPDLSRDPRRVAYRSEGVNRGSLFSVPVIYQDRLLGTFNFASPKQEAFSPEKRELFSAVANQGALALANAQLFRQTLELSRIDGLTSVANRRELAARLSLEHAAAERHKEPLSIVVLDVDQLKKYNADHGRNQGDEVLRRIARILETHLRKSDALGRSGGDEFTIILPRTSPEQARMVADKLQRSIEQADFEGGYMQPRGRLTVSLGVATWPEDAKTAADLWARAESIAFGAQPSVDLPGSEP